MFGPFSKIFDHKSLSFDTWYLFVQEVKQNFVLKLGMNALLVGPVKPLALNFSP